MVEKYKEKIACVIVGGMFLTVFAGGLFSLWSIVQMLPLMIS